jgi:hypothetical protein
MDLIKQHHIHHFVSQITVKLKRLNANIAHKIEVYLMMDYLAYVLTVSIKIHWKFVKNAISLDV